MRQMYKGSRIEMRHYLWRVKDRIRVPSKQTRLPSSPKLSMSRQQRCAASGVSNSTTPTGIVPNSGCWKFYLYLQHPEISKYLGCIWFKIFGYLRSFFYNLNKNDLTIAWQPIGQSWIHIGWQEFIFSVGVKGWSLNLGWVGEG